MDRAVPGAEHHLPLTAVRVAAVDRGRRRHTPRRRGRRAHAQHRGGDGAGSPALHTLVYDRLRRTRDIEAAKLYGRSQTEAIHHAAAIVEELGIECDWEDTAAFTYAAAAQKIEDLRVQLARAEDFAATLRTRLEHTTRS